MAHDDKLTTDEKAVYSCAISAFFNTSLAAEDAVKAFKNPMVAANLKASAAFAEAACSLIEIENDLRRALDGNNSN